MPHLPRFPRPLSVFLLVALTGGVSSSALAAPAVKPSVSSTPGRVLSVQDRGAVTQAAVGPATAKLYSRSGAPDAKYGVQRYRLNFQSTDERGQPITVAAQLYVPVMATGARVPLYVMGPGTTGLDNACAPTREVVSQDNWGDYEAHMLSYAAQGYVAILPDWANFDDASKPQPYFVANSEGRIMLDATRAARSFFQGVSAVTPNEHTFFAGFSQGGHAAFAGADLAASYAPELRISGVIGYAPAMDVATLFRERPALGPYLARSYAAYYGLDPAKVLQPRWLAALDREAGKMCVTQVYRHYPHVAESIYRPEFLAALRSGQIQRYDANLARMLKSNAPGFAPQGRVIPALVLTGMTDPIVTANAQLSFMRKSCAFGRAIVQREYADANHFQARQFGFRDTLAWMEDLSRGKVAPSSCTEAKYNIPKRAKKAEGTPVFVSQNR
ncbi:secretory lipase [Deinococcus peraridilitoris]|uniref:Secretory lipase n=1 Tax=Deinococcus peraridilitoris (strain DSM 19664 / LMG 22246 / CIP 109416 / KR-200) TaxID=937777 RepID=L0A2V5_DEIPD|nr:secretory lipase [Deinococcus peraridilitoris]AFZ67779.1 Secretory lipase [Deinococcus peraridilitoris DSM 19664]